MTLSSVLFPFDMVARCERGLFPLSLLPPYNGHGQSVSAFEAINSTAVRGSTLVNATSFYKA